MDIFYFLKTGVGSALSIIIANKFGLHYSASAGIITLLTIQNTKKETIEIAIKRVMAFILAVTIAYGCFSIMGYTSLAFGLFVFIFVAFCNLFGLQDGIAMNSVLMTHFLIEKQMTIPFIFNEIYILLIGMSIGVILNLVMPKSQEKIVSRQKDLDEEMRSVLRKISRALREKTKEVDFTRIDYLIECLLEIAYEESDNRLIRDTGYLISYLEMRKIQICVLRKIQEDIEKIDKVVPQSYLVSDYIDLVAGHFHEENDVKDLLERLGNIYIHLNEEPLPTSREEFENRAILFSILKEVEYFLIIKRDFARQVR